MPISSDLRNGDVARLGDLLLQLDLGEDRRRGFFEADGNSGGVGSARLRRIQRRRDESISSHLLHAIIE